MISIEGRLHDGTTSRVVPARLDFYDGGEVVLAAEGATAVRHGRSTLEITDRLGNTPRRIRFPDGGQFETADNDAVDRALRHRRLGGAGWVHRLERSYLIAVVSLLLVIVLGVLFFRDGVPALSKAIAFGLPPAASSALGKETFHLLDEQLFDPSTLEEATRGRLRGEFAELSAGLGPHFQLHFRHGGERIGANAFALPDGTVVMTDELVALADNDQELLAVLAHEAGHVVDRHGLRQVLQHSIITLFVLYATGDASNLVAALPMVLVQAGYSRAFEREADGFALELLRERGIAPRNFALILRKIEAENRERREGAEREGRTVFSYLSTHPDTEERVRAFLH
ncbi:M48 family metallopeptidase [Endothiovibrio diazotrophicus]